MDLGAIRYYGIAEGAVAGIPALVARTGYTGEDGFEVFVDAARAGRALGRARSRPARPHGLVPVGLGARDTLRLEAGMPLYGNELDRDHDTLRGGPRPGRQAGQGRATSWVAPRSRRPPPTGPRRRLVGLVVRGPRDRPPRLPGLRRRPADAASSPPGRMSPTLGVPIAMAYVAPGDAAPGTMLDVEIRDARVAAEVVPLPFYTRPALTPGTPARRDAVRAERARPRAGARRRTRPMVPADLRYTKEHEWVRVEGDVATVGHHRSHAADQLGDIVFVELPAVGRGARRSSRPSASSSRSRPSATCSPRSRGEVVEANDGARRRARAGQQRPVRRGLDAPHPPRRPGRSSTRSSTRPPTSALVAEA